MKRKQHFWIRCSLDQTRSTWWPQWQKAFPRLKDLTEEKWSGQDLKWPALLDSARSFTLFARQKIILVQDGDKALKALKNPLELFQDFESCPHSIVILSESKAPKDWPFEVWEAPSIEIEESYDKALFQWVDQIDRTELRSALRDLDRALESGQHPLVCLQMLTRHFRMGRLVTYAQKKGLSDNEITRVLKLPRFVVEKWRKKSPISLRQWNEIFYRLSEADLHLKSGFDHRDILRKLSHDLCQIRKVKIKTREERAITTPSLFGSKLWPVAPSFS
jgi:DNA polymerase III delta subunit